MSTISSLTPFSSFCEEDYAISYYLAEFINSISNIAYSQYSCSSSALLMPAPLTHPCVTVYLALRAMFCRQHNKRITLRADYLSLSLLILGINSFLFHATLRALPEFCDELGMLGLTWSLLQATLCMRQSSLARVRAITVVLAAAYIIFSAVYILYLPHIIYQVIAFTTALVGVLLRSQYLLHWVRPPFAEAKRREWNVRVWKAVGICIAGYVLWNVDLECCMWLRGLRAKVGLPWAWALELHGWWHVLTAVGAARVMDVVRDVWEEEERERKEGKKMA